jgi:hypothetical protein
MTGRYDGEAGFLQPLNFPFYLAAIHCPPPRAAVVMPETTILTRQVFKRRTLLNAPPLSLFLDQRFGLGRSLGHSHHHDDFCNG